MSANSTIASEFLISALQLLLLSTQIPCSWCRPGGGQLLLISGPTLGDFPSFSHPKIKVPCKNSLLELYFPPRSLSISLWWKMPTLHLGPIVVPCAQETRVQGWVPHTAHSPWSPTHLHTIHLHTIHHTWHTYTFWYTYMWYTYTPYACTRHACTRYACTRQACMQHTYMWHVCTRHACTRHTYMQHACAWHACTRYISLWLQQPLWINQPSLQWWTSISLEQATAVSTLKTDKTHWRFDSYLVIDPSLVVWTWDNYSTPVFSTEMVIMRPIPLILPQITPVRAHCLACGRSCREMWFSSLLSPSQLLTMMFYLKVHLVRNICISDR